jgi:hypothetical protein
VRASEYGGEQQRWLVVESAQRLQSDNKAISQKIEKADKVVKKEWQQGERTLFLKGRLDKGFRDHD